MIIEIGTNISNLPNEEGAHLVSELLFVFTDHGTVSFQFHASTKATHKIKRTVYDYRNGDFDRLRGALEALNLCNLIQDSEDINLDWTYWKDAFMSAVSDFIPGKKRPAFLCGKRRLPAQS